MTIILSINHPINHSTNWTTNHYSNTYLSGLKIAIEDANDNAPVFVGGESAEARLVEDALPETEVTRVRAEDADSGDRGRVTYALTQQTPPGKNSVDRTVHSGLNVYEIDA